MKKILSIALLLSGISFSSMAQETPNTGVKGETDKIEMTHRSDDGKSKHHDGNKDAKFSDKKRDTTANSKTHKKGQSEHCKGQKDSTNRVRNNEKRGVEKKGIEKKDLKKSNDKK